LESNKEINRKGDSSNNSQRKRKIKKPDKFTPSKYDKKN
jgi:hypothetical protein